MSDLDGLINLIPIGDIATKLGIPPAIAEMAVKAAVPAIVGGLAANAKTPEGAKSIEKALTRHVGLSPKAQARADAEDGQKIVNNVFGAKTEQVTAAVAEKAGGGATQDIIAKVLPIVAPIILSFIASKVLGGGSAAAPTTATAAPAASGGGIGDILGGLMGSQAGQDMIGGVLGGLLGGGKK
ncbi:MAG: DUF937 domain-containing protein [Rhodoglobus sp.]